MIACLIVAAYICWQLLLLSLVVAPLAGLLIGFLAKTLKRANRKALEEMSSLYTILVETFSGIKVVKAFTMERYERQRFHATSKKCYRKSDADRPGRRPDQSGHGSDGHRDDLPGDPVRRVPGDEPPTRTCWASRCATGRCRSAR